MKIVTLDDVIIDHLLLEREVRSLKDKIKRNKKQTESLASTIMASLKFIIIAFKKEISKG